MAVISVSDSVKKELLRHATRLQSVLGEKMDLERAIWFLLTEAKPRNPDLLIKACKAKGGEEALKELYVERAKDEERLKRKYGA